MRAAASQSCSVLAATVADALAGRTELLELTDEKGKQFLVPAARVSYVEVGTNDSRSVGFNAS